MSLSARLKAWLNGEDAAVGHPITDDAYRTELQLGDLLDIVATLSGTATGEGTDLIGVPDGSGYFTGTNLSDVLDELYVAATTGGSDSFTDTNNYYPTDTVGAALVALGVAIGGSTTIARNYTSNKFLTDDATILAALSALDAGAAAAYYAYGNGLAARKNETRVATDLAALRTQLAAAIVDLPAVRTPTAANVVDVAALLYRLEHSAYTSGAIGDGGTNGRLRTTPAVSYRIGGALYDKGGTDDLWNLSAELATDGTHFRAYWLYLDAAGTASFAAGTDELSLNAAVAALPAVTATKAVIGVYVAGVSTNFANALAAQGTIYNGWPTAQTLTAAAPAALTSSAPAALVSAALGTTVLAQGGTAGRIKLNADLEFNIGGARYTKAPTDDLWNLSALGTTGGAEYKAVRLYLSTAGAGSVDAGTAAASAAAAKAALPALDPTRAHVGTYVMNPSGDFANALDAQGTYQDGWPVAVAS